MLVLITTRCHEGCAHCMHDANPNGRDMTRRTMQDVLTFLKKVNPLLIQISGGEPTLNPDFFDFTTRVSSAHPKSMVLIESNGSFYQDSRLTAILRLVRLPNVAMQIRTHKDLYPNYRSIINNPTLKALPKTLIFEDNIQITPMGRAAGMPTTRRFATCINTYLVAKQKPNFTVAEIARCLQENKRFCAPMIGPDGVLHAGESIFCTELGHVNSPRPILDTRPCGKCGLV